MNKVEINSWSEFRKHVESERAIVPVYWRGQKDPTWPLASAFEREILRMAGGSNPGAAMTHPYGNRYVRPGGVRIWSDTFYATMRDRHLAAFKSAAAGLRGSNPAQLNDDQWWALGRHYGLITPLLDWTESPYIAAHFPLTEVFAEMQTPSGPQTQRKRLAVYRLVCNESLPNGNLRVVRPVVDELGRMHGQRGLFTWLNSEDFFELQGFLDAKGQGNLLTQFSISDQAVMDGLRDLRDHGIDARLLFPDLHGAAMQANTRWDIF